MFQPFYTRSLFWFVAWAAAFHPVLVWWVERTADTSDDAPGLVALLVLLGVSLRERSTNEPDPGVLGAVLAAGYAASFVWAPNLVRGLFAAAVLGVMIGRLRGTGRWHFGTWGLVAMTLPMLASLRFFLGYPLRWITTQVTAFLLKLGGNAVQVDGLALVMGDVEVWVDGPCSGVQMLWVGVFLAAALAFVFRLRNWATVALFFLSLLATVTGNIWRASGVFYMEAGLLDAPAVFHDLVGMGAFAVVAVGVASAGFALRRFSVEEQYCHRTARWVVVPVFCLAAMAPLLAPPSQAAPAEHVFPGWPEQLEGKPLEPRELSDRDKPYLAGFPGKVAGFRAPGEEVLLRWVTMETRRLHSAADCYRGLGYDVEPLQPRYRGYASFRVVDGEQSYVVSEMIEDRSGARFGEVGEWYWSAKLGRTAGPWWSVVRVQQDDSRE